MNPAQEKLIKNTWGYMFIASREKLHLAYANLYESLAKSETDKYNLARIERLEMLADFQYFCDQEDK